MAAREGGESAYIQQIHCSLYIRNYHNRTMQLYSKKREECRLMSYRAIGLEISWQRFSCESHSNFVRWCGDLVVMGDES